MAARMGPLVLLRTPYAVSSARNNFKIDRYLNFSTGQISDRYSGGVKDTGIFSVKTKVVPVFPVPVLNSLIF